jgi:hypothetical protein
MSFIPSVAVFHLRRMYGRKERTTFNRERMCGEIEH